MIRFKHFATAACRGVDREYRKKLTSYGILAPLANHLKGLDLQNLTRERRPLHVSAFRGVPSKVVETSPEANDPAERRSPPSERVQRLVEEIASLTLLEVSDLTQLLKKRLGLPDIPMGGMMMPMGMPMPSGQGGAGSDSGAAAGAAEPAKVEKTAFDVKLEKFDAAAKLKVVKEVRAITSLGLKESKDLVEQTPAILKKGVSKEEAEGIIEKLKAIGATCVME
eukprot:TRINITY_DN12757_c0_g1_i1.p1 TRINITY_DN12757_c0_g1~~TRINITY_DN12757_c0_g1_i1.p1  ORF type:complete len:224 (-),score=47.15 TRINITY_DN12757_c0_g1_i1:275-946(-)